MKNATSGSTTPHQHGHRKRLRERFLTGGNDALADYEMLEMVLFAAQPRGDVKPLAKRLIQTFGSFADVVQATPEALKSVEGVGDAAIASIKVIESSCTKLLRQRLDDKPIINSWTSLLDYCQIHIGSKSIESFHVLFLNTKNILICDEQQQTGTINHTPVYPREVVKRALEVGAAAIILVHNHPSGDPSPSKADIDVTRTICDAASPLNIRVFDHLIIAASGHYSFKSHGLV